FNREVILPREKALVSSGSLAVLRGNLAPNGAVIKPAAAESQLLTHTGPPVVSADYNDMAARIHDPALPVTPACVIVPPHPGPPYERGCGALYQRHITQADEGCDFDFLEGTAPTAEPEIH